MKNLSKKIVLILIAAIMAISVVSCKKDIHEQTDIVPSVTFGFKQNDTADDFNESLTAFEVGKRFYVSIKLKIVTDKKKTENFRVEIKIPHTKNVEVKGLGGMEPDKNDFDSENGYTKLTYTVSGSKEAIEQNLSFYGTPTKEGTEKMTVKIFDEDGNQIGTDHFRNLIFEYDLQKDEE